MSLEHRFPFLSQESKSLFPLQTISDLEQLFDLEVISKEDPNLAVWSIILGCIENSLVLLDYSSATPVVLGASVKLTAKKKGAGSTSPVSTTTTRKSVGALKRRKGGRGKATIDVEFKEGKGGGGGERGPPVLLPIKGVGGGKSEEKSPAGEDGMSDKENVNFGDFPKLELDLVEALYWKFCDMLKTCVDLKKEFGLDDEVDVENTPRELVGKVSEVLWGGLSRSYRGDTPHIQSLYTYLMGKKLSSFGVSLAVVAGCQLLRLRDVHLMLSEDHSWIGFGGMKGKNCPKQTFEATWHGKGVEDKIGKEVALGDDEDSWLYQKGHAVYCSRQMEVAAMVVSINSAINATLNSLELVNIQQKLLWKLYDAGHLKKYPMGLMTLADLEEIKVTPGKPTCPTLFQDAVVSGRSFYADMHIYPYTTYAAYCFRNSDYKTSLKYWAHAARIVQKFRRSKNDEEIYREFFEISTDALVKVMKSCSTGFSANSIVRDPMCFAHLLRFFDGICAWEERSKSSIVHITWAKSWVTAIGRFDYTIRRLVRTSEGALAETFCKNGSNENGTAEDELEKDSGIDEEDEPSPSVTLFSRKMRQMKHFFKLEKYNPSAITLLLTAQTAVEESVATKETNGHGPGIRSRRERLSQNIEVPRMDMDEDSSDTLDKAPRKRAKISLS